MNGLPRILLVEDSLRDAEMVIDALEAHNLANSVLHVRDGAEALDFLFRRGAFADHAREQPAVVLLDLKMPRVDGLEVLRQIKSDPELRRIPVVVMTSSQEDQDIVNSYKLGVNAYVVKPVQFHAFAEAVSQVGRFWAVVNEPPAGTVPNSPSMPGPPES